MDCRFIFTTVLYFCAAALVAFPHAAASEPALPIPSSRTSIDASLRAYPRLLKMLDKRKLAFGSPVFIRIFKKSEELELWLQKSNGNFKLFKTYAICFRSGGLGPKEKEGDLQNPEGFYEVDYNQLNPWSKFHLAFNLGYPNEFDMVHNRTGDSLMVHGRCSSSGCFAMTDYYMDEIYTLAEAALANGQPSFQVHIFPFRLTSDNLEKYRESQWFSFWLNLKSGFDFFEKYHFPPEVNVRQKRYVFSFPDSDRLSVNTADQVYRPILYSEDLTN